MAARAALVALMLSCLLYSCMAADIDLSLIKLPDGFAIEKYGAVPAARSLFVKKHGSATVTYVGTNTLFSAGFTKSGVWALVDIDSDGKVDYTQLLADNIDTPNGIAMKDSNLYISGWIDVNTTAGTIKKGVIFKLKNAPQYALRKRTFKGQLPIETDQLPGDTWHGWRYMVASPTSNEILVAVGANCNICLLNTTKEGIAFGSIYAFNLDTKKFKRVASGVRNSVGMTFHPRTKDLWFTDNGRDDWGGTDANVTDNVPDDELNMLEKGSALAAFGYPFCAVQGAGNPYLRNIGYGDNRDDPDVNKDGSVQDCTTATFNRPKQALGPHTASLGLSFYKWTPSANFTKEWGQTLFVAQHGSWNRQLKIGYRVMMLKLNAEGKAVNEFKEFATGWLQDEETKEASVKGRPVDVAQLPDGSLVVSDDFLGLIYRIYYKPTTN